MKQSADHILVWNDYIKKLEDLFCNYTPRIYQDSDYQAIIVEPRKHPHLETVIKNVMYFLNETNSDVKWGLRIFHGNGNKEYIEDITKDWKGVELTNILFHNLSSHEYNDWARTKKFWGQIEKNNVLLFQVDSLLLRDGIDEFLEWDYIGAPWTSPKEGKLVGNGGLSFRKTKKMIDIIDKNLYISYINEDIYFCKFIKDLPPVTTAKKFSVEDLYYDNPLGIHQPKIELEKLKELLDKSSEKIKI